MPKPTVQGFKVTAEEIQAYNDAYLSRFYSGSAVLDAASISGLTSLQELHKAIASNTITANKVYLAELCRKDILQHFLRDEIETATLTDQEIITRLKGKYDPKTIQVVMGKLLGVLTKPQLDQASLSRLENLGYFAAVTVFAQYGMDLFFEFISLNTFIHNPGLIKLLNAVSNPQAPIQDQRQILEQIINSLFAEAIYSINDWIEHDINPRKLLVLLQNEDTQGLVNELDKYAAINIKTCQFLSTIAKALIEAKNSHELLDKIRKPLNDCQMEWFKQFGHETLRTGGRGSFIIEDGRHLKERILLTFSVVDNTVQVSKTSAKTGKLIAEPQVLRQILESENKEYSAALAVADYFKNEYQMSNELIAHLILSEHQSGFMGTVLAISGNLSLGHETYLDKDKVSIKTIPSRSLLQFNEAGQLASIEQEIPFELISCTKQEADSTSGELIKTLGTLTIKRSSFNKLSGDLPISAYVPGVFPPFEGEISYSSYKNNGLLTAPNRSVFTSKLILNIRRHPIKACLFFIVGCLITALGVAAWPATAALLSGASIAGAAVAVATFITTLTTPILAGMGAGTFGGGLLTLLLSGLFMKPKVKQPVRLSQKNYQENVKDFLISESKAAISSSAGILVQLGKSEIDDLRIMIQLIKEAFVPNDKAKINDLALLTTKVALLENLKNFLEPLMAKDDTPAKLMTAFESLLDSAKAQSQNTNPKMVEAFISHLESLSLDSLKSIIALMKEKFPNITPGSSPRSAGSSPSRPEPQKVAPATPTRDASATRRALKESGESASLAADATKATLLGDKTSEGHRTSLVM